MRYFILLFVLTIALSSGFGQDDANILIKKWGDSILKKYELERDLDARNDMLLRFNSFSRLESDPLNFIEFGSKVYKISQKNNDRTAEAAAWSYYGQGYRLMGNYTKALECHYKAIEIATKYATKSQIAHSYNQLGHIYKDREENDKAIEIYRIANQFSEEGVGKISRYGPPMNLGSIFLNKGMLDSSIYYSNVALDKLHNRNENQSIFIPVILGNLGAAYSRMNKKKEAEKYFQNALLIVTNSNFTSPRTKVGLYFNISDHFRRNLQIDSCLFYAKLSIAAVNNTLFSYLMAKPAKTLSEIYEGTNSDSTVKYLKIYHKSNEVINSTRVTQQLQMMAFEEEQRKLELEQTRKEAQARIKVYFLVAVILLVSLFGFLMFRSNKQKQKVNLQLQKQKQEIEMTLEKLTSTQSQLVQAEKMASLGELTAGIAHEIQNPLNFVNNFAEVNTELVDELKKEIEPAGIPIANELIEDIKANSEKITFHGKRADAIVKSMLQHSRKSSGQKELTDINALCDEYLRLSYHGLRAKDKSFNAEFDTQFDTTLAPISVVPQDIGRVILNLINNAFYAVNERQKKDKDSGYKPRVTLTTRQEGNQVVIEVADNGTGMPDQVKEKIFQPFFTTKPTGEGTGLGLSLSYDIVTKGHHGIMDVESAEGLGTRFQVKLPFQV
ncbi:MAG: tetratricopeptide repeat protein [Chitinophagaceae bacterium]|nr:tetratricopeptide repeat protein [Chitinophagaceae bacterium]